LLSLILIAADQLSQQHHESLILHIFNHITNLTGLSDHKVRHSHSTKWSQPNSCMWWGLSCADRLLSLHYINIDRMSVQYLPKVEEIFPRSLAIEGTFPELKWDNLIFLEHPAYVYFVTFLPCSRLLAGLFGPCAKFSQGDFEVWAEQGTLVLNLRDTFRDSLTFSLYLVCLLCYNVTLKCFKSLNKSQMLWHRYYR